MFGIDYTKQRDVRERVWQQHWDLLIIDPDVFPEPHRYGDQAQVARRSILRWGASSPWAIRRLKEDLRDVNGRRLFPDRHAQTVTFQLNREEYALYRGASCAACWRSSTRNVAQDGILRYVDAQPAVDFVRAGHQLDLRRIVQEELRRYTGIVRDYLTSSFEARIQASEGRVMSLRARELAGEADAALARQRAEQDLTDPGRARGERLGGLDRLAITRPGLVRLLATALVLPPEGVLAEALPPGEPDADAIRASDLAAMGVVMAFERARGWEPHDVSRLHDKCGFDIRSFGPADPATGQRPVRRIEVKGRRRGQPIRMTANEWR